MGGFNTFGWNTSLFGGPGGGAPVPTPGILVEDLLYVALRIAGVLGVAGRGAGPEQITDAFNALNSWVDSLNIERLMIRVVARLVVDIISNKADYQVGPTAVPPDWNVPWYPSRIEAASLIYNSVDTALPLEIPMDQLNTQQWQGTPIKSITSTIPQFYYYEPYFGNSTGLGQGAGICHLYPVPQIANQVALYLWQTLSQFSTTSDSVIAPPGYLRFLQYGLAMELDARPWSPSQVQKVPMSADAKQIAIDSKQAIKRLNRVSMEMTCDSAVLGRPRGSWNWRTGEYQR
jgi:hypothetical protein